MFVTFDTGKNTYKCRLSTRTLVELEDKLGDNPINIMSRMGENGVPKLNTLMIILFYGIKDMNHGIKMDDIYTIFDEYCENGGSILTLMEFIMNMFVESGILGKADKEDEVEGSGNEKN